MKTFFKVTLKVLLGIVVLIAVVVGIAFYATSGIADVANKQLSLIREGKVEEAYFTYTSKDFQAATTLDDFKGFVNDSSAFGKNKEATFNSRVVINDNGSLEGALMGIDGSSIAVKYSLVKEGGGWKISSIVFPKE